MPRDEEGARRREGEHRLPRHNRRTDERIDQRRRSCRASGIFARPESALAHSGRRNARDGRTQRPAAASCRASGISAAGNPRSRIPDDGTRGTDEHSDQRRRKPPRFRDFCGRESALADSRPAKRIGVPRFELGASPTRTERATRLRHTPSAERVPAPIGGGGPPNRPLHSSGDPQYAPTVTEALERRAG